MMGANDKVEATFHPHHPMDAEPYLKSSRLKERGPGIYTTDEFEATRRPHPIEKLTAPPETLVEHLKRIKVPYEFQTIRRGKVQLIIDMDDLNAIENPKEGHDGK